MSMLPIGVFLLKTYRVVYLLNILKKHVTDCRAVNVCDSIL